ncbi:oligosaccharide flippase family protein [Ligilactobacillus equi]
MKVIHNYLYNAGYQVLAIIVPLITSAYISRVLRPEGVGANAFTNSIIQYFILLASIGIGYYGNREIAYVRENRTKMSQTFWEIQIIKTLMTLIAYLVFVVFMMFYTLNKTYMWAQSINLVAVAFDISWLYMGIEDFKRTVIRNTLVKIVSTIAIFIFIRDAQDVTLYIIVLALSTFIGNLTLWSHLCFLLEKVSFKELNPWRHFVPAVAMFVPQIATQLYVQLNRTMLGVMIGETASGYYQYSDSLVKLVLALVTATGTVMLPHVSNAFSKGDMNKVNQMLYKSFDFVSAIAFPMAFGLGAVAMKLGPYYYGYGYNPVGPAMLIESIVILLIGWSNVLGTQYLLPVNRVKQFTTSVSLGAVTNIVLNIPLIYLWKLNGAMVSTVLSELVVTLYQIWVVRNDLDFKELFSDTWKYLLASVVMFAPVYWMNSNFLTTWSMLGLEVIVGVAIYAVMILILRPQILNSAKQIILERKK